MKIQVYSKYLTLFFLFLLPILGFYFGKSFNQNEIRTQEKSQGKYNQETKNLEQNKKELINFTKNRFVIYDPSIPFGSAESSDIEIINDSSEELDFRFTVKDYGHCAGNNNNATTFCPQESHKIDFPKIIDEKLVYNIDGKSTFLAENLVVQRDNVIILTNTYEDLNNFFVRGIKVFNIEFFKIKTNDYIEYFENEVGMDIGPYRFLSTIGDGGYGYGGHARIQPICFDTQKNDLYIHYKFNMIDRIFRLQENDKCQGFLMDGSKCGVEVNFKDISCTDKVLDIKEYPEFLEKIPRN